MTLGSRRLSDVRARQITNPSCPRERNGFLDRGGLLDYGDAYEKHILPEEPARRVEVLEARQRIERKHDERELHEGRERRPGPEHGVRHHCDQPVRPRASCQMLGGRIE